MLDSPREVIRSLLTYSDWWQPSTTSLLQVAAARRSKDLPEGLHPGMVETLEERTELCARMTRLSSRDRHLLFLWYVKQLTLDDIASAMGISRRQCCRRRATAVKRIVNLGVPKDPAAPTGG